VNEPSVVFSSSKLPSHAGGKLLELPRQKIGWEWMSFYVTRLQPGEVMRRRTEKEESAFVLLGGSCVADWGDGKRTIGKRQNVFAGLPYTLYLPAHSEVSFTAETACEFAECSVPSNAQLEPRLITPGDVVTSLRGGGNVSRQIVDVMPPAFPADKLVVIEVYTPGGNWSSYPPHKHDVHNPPAEVDLEEIYYYRLDRPEGYAIQKVYTADRRIDETLSVRDGELVLIPEGYHPVVAAHGYNVYYLNALAGSARSMAASDDPDYAWVRDTWREQDPRLPMVKM
jgi:5-deoxy-glucuronate isomerase